MAGAEKVAVADPTMAITQWLTQLGGTKNSTSTSTTSDPSGVAALQQILNSQMAGTTPEGAAALMQAIFAQGMEKVPELATTYGQAAGARTGGNSPLQMSMQDMFLKLSQEGARQLSTNQQAAARTASELTNSTKTQTQTQKTKPANQALQLAPFILANLGKVKKLFDPQAAGNDLNGLSNPNPAASASFNINPRGFETGANTDSFNVNNFASSGSDAFGFDMGSSAADGFDMDAFNASGSDMFGFDSGVFDTMGTDMLEGGFLGFKNGGVVDRKKLMAAKRPGYAEGGVVTKNRDFSSAGGQSLNTDSGAREISTAPRGEEYKQLLLSMVGDTINPALKSSASTKAPNGSKPRKPTNTELMDAGSTGVGEGQHNGQIGTPAENAAAIAGAISLGLTMALGVPGVVGTTAMNMMGIPNTTMNPVSQLASFVTNLATGSTASNDTGLSPDSVAAATGIAGANAGGLGGMGVSMGLDAGFDPSNPGSDGSAGAGDSGGVGDAASAGVGGGGFKKGGDVQGKGGPTDDAITIDVSDGEYVLKAKAVQGLGVEFLDMLNTMFD
jgi:hypothetical protein